MKEERDETVRELRKKLVSMNTSFRVSYFNQTLNISQTLLHTCSRRVLLKINAGHN